MPVRWDVFRPYPLARGERANYWHLRSWELAFLYSVFRPYPPARGEKANFWYLRSWELAFLLRRVRLFGSKIQFWAKHIQIRVSQISFSICEFAFLALKSNSGRNTCSFMPVFVNWTSLCYCDVLENLAKAGYLAWFTFLCPRSWILMP